MRPLSLLKSFKKFASENSTYVDENYMDDASANFDRGFEPLETLPATWYNSLMYLLTEQAQNTKTMVDDIRSELLTILEKASIDPNAASVAQVYTAIMKLCETTIATATKLGGLISSLDADSVSIDPNTGKPTVNALNDWTDSDGTVKEYIDTYAGGDAKYQFLPDYANATSWITGTTLTSSNPTYEYTAPANGYLFCMLQQPGMPVGGAEGGGGVTLSVNGVHIATLGQASCQYGIDITLAQAVSTTLMIKSGQKLTVSRLDITYTLNITIGDALTAADFNRIGSICRFSFRFVPLEWVSDAPEIHATSATYLRPADSTSTSVTATSTGRLVARELLLDSNA